MSVYFTDDTVTLHLGKAIDVLATLPAASVNCVVTSPPYWRQRDYGIAGQAGLERTPAAYVAALVAVMGEVRRVLTDDGTVWLNLGDSYSGHAAAARATSSRRDRASVLPARTNSTTTAPRKSLLMMPARVAIALVDDGWVLRNNIIWHKTNAMPESVTDRFSATHESLFMLTKTDRYFFNLDAVKVPAIGRRGSTSTKYSGRTRTHGGNPRSTLDQAFESRNPGDVWDIATAGFTGHHFAVMPAALAERCVRAGCTPGGVVLDPFCGTGTTGLVAGRLGHLYIGVDLDPAALAVALNTRLSQTTIVDRRLA